MIHPETDFLEEAFDIVMLKRELMGDLQLIGRIRHFEIRYDRYETWMRSQYHHEDDWPMFDPTDDYTF